MSEQSQTLYKGKFLSLVKEGRWEYAHREGATGAAIILAITPDDKILFCEQYRIPVHSRTIELPAGLTGDTGTNESDAEAAGRELLEETGWEAAEIQPLLKGPASSGLTSEVVTIFHAKNLKRVHAGGGIEHEEITVHEVARKEVREWLEGKQRDGCLIEPKIFAALFLAKIG